MTRQRSRGSLFQTVFMDCPYCHGTGLVKSLETMSINIERSLKKLINCNQQFAIKLVTNPELDSYLNVIDKRHLKKLAESLNARLEFEADDTLHLNDFEFYSSINNELIEV
jgi:ribonuclease G